MSNDSQLKQSVLAELSWEPSVGSAHIGVSATGGHIRLTGTFRSPHERQVVANTAWAAPGAIADENDLRVA